LRVRLAYGMLATILLGAVVAVVILQNRKGRIKPPAPVSVFVQTDAGAAGMGVDSETHWQVPPPWTLTRSTNRARVYLDTSMSVRGFVKVHEFGQLLEKLKYVLVGADVDRFEVAEVAEKVGSLQEVAQFNDFANARLYDGRETNLKAAIDDATKWNAGEILVLTDGIVSLSKPEKVGPSGSSALSCGAGSDAACIAVSVAEYVGHGNGFWIVGMRLPYAGPYYVEEPGPNCRRGQIVRGPLSLHPFYIWVGSPSLSQGRKVVKELLDFASVQKLQALAIEAAPGQWQGWKVDPGLRPEELMASENEACAHGDLVSEVEFSGGSTCTVTVSQHAKEGWGFGASPKPALGFALPVTDVMEATSDAIPLIEVRQQFVLSDPSVRLISKVDDVKGHSAVSRHYLDTCLQYEGALSRSRAGRSLLMNSLWKIARSSEEPWTGWSTDTDCDPKSLDRTVNLDMFLRLLREELASHNNSESQTKTEILTIQYAK
jgi:hypothetical protein